MKYWKVNGLLFLFFCPIALQAADPLPSWNGGGSRDAIMAFVERVTENGGADYVPPEARIATFDNDGTLWSEQPVYFQAIFAFDQIRDMAPEHPQWKQEEPYASVLRGDTAGALAGGEQSVLAPLVVGVGNDRPVVHQQRHDVGVAILGRGI